VDIDLSYVQVNAYDVKCMVQMIIFLLLVINRLCIYMSTIA